MKARVLFDHKHLTKMAGNHSSQRGFAWGADDEYLRRVEVDVLIPKKMREKAKELCHDKVEAFNRCCSDNNLTMFVKCRKENSALKECIKNYYVDKNFFEECKKEYLAERKEFRDTGVSPIKKDKSKRL